MANPAKAQKFHALSLKVIQQQRKKIKIISQAKDRYKQRIITMKHLLNDLQSKNLITENGANAVDVSDLYPVVSDK